MTVLYESNAIVFPTATSTVSFNPIRNAKSSSMDIGGEYESEQLLQILESTRVKDRIISEFNLPEVYEIESDEKNFKYNLNEAYEQHISFARTRFGSIEISVLDEDPQRSTNIANRIVNLIDTVKNNLIKERTIPAYEVNKRKIDKLTKKKDDLINEMDSLSNIGVVDVEARANLFEAMNESKTKEDKLFFKHKIDVNFEHGAKYDALAALREFRIEKLTAQEEIYEQSVSDAFEDYTHKLVVEWAVPSDKKAEPKRSIVVLVFTFATLFFVIITLLIRDKAREIRKQA
jgi:hypothetical protein